MFYGFAALSVLSRSADRFYLESGAFAHYPPMVRSLLMFITIMAPDIRTWTSSSLLHPLPPESPHPPTPGFI